MLPIRPQPSPSEVLDRVLGKGIVVTTVAPGAADTEGGVSVAGLGVLDVRSRVVISDLDAETGW